MSVDVDFWAMFDDQSIEIDVSYFKDGRDGDWVTVGFELFDGNASHGEVKFFIRAEQVAELFGSAIHKYQVERALALQDVPWPDAPSPDTDPDAESDDDEDRMLTPPFVEDDQPEEDFGQWRDRVITDIRHT